MSAQAQICPEQNFRIMVSQSQSPLARQVQGANMITSKFEEVAAVADGLMILMI
jgi:hypothetical protein